MQDLHVLQSGPERTLQRQQTYYGATALQPSEKPPLCQAIEIISGCILPGGGLKRIAIERVRE
jgi:hypothetical protein